MKELVCFILIIPFGFYLGKLLNDFLTDIINHYGSLNLITLRKWADYYEIGYSQDDSRKNLINKFRLNGIVND